MTISIDWVTAPFHRHPASARGYAPSDWSRVRGPHGVGMGIVVRDGQLLTVSGNPKKYLLGHNLCGPPALVPLMAQAVEDIAARCGIVLTKTDRDALTTGEYRVSRVDLDRPYDLRDRATVRRFLATAAPVCRIRGQKTSVEEDGTIYIGKRSKRLTLKLYDKEAELRKHPLPAMLPAAHKAALQDFAVGKLKVEVTLKSTELAQRGLNRASLWTPELAERVFEERLAKVEMLDTMRLPEDELHGLDRRLLATYEMWRAGYDLRARLSRSTFYAHRRALREAHGIDIAHVRSRAAIDRDERLRDRPLKAFLAGPGVPPPDWAVGTPLLALSGSALVTA